ncbi:MAG: LssY C-terminal domain-containing protein [Edaphobacter sp.]|uniref:LssY C-terminal domain-containing protein n=1 Tax=Edaphobacter sp. TaxID=1934404 RepID=UPI00238CC93D|nr:LssY C-terminal domain-containing protein [Edaphobacter sp.]MDE1178549.1 LssY C-terminal domain-containing protein [Edaphobacter sp.]
MICRASVFVVLRRVAPVLLLSAAAFCVAQVKPHTSLPVEIEAPKPVPKPLDPIRIVHKPGHEHDEAGEAELVPATGKPRKITPNAVAAWRVRGEYGALVIAVVPAKHELPKRYMLRYYDLDSGRRRILGTVPFSAATLTETRAADESWAFALSGTDEQGTPWMVVGDEQAIPGRIANAASPDFHENDHTVTYTVGGESRKAQLGVLLGTDLHEIYTPPQNAQLSPKYLQVFPNGDALVQLESGQIVRGRWSTNGETLELTGLRVAYAVPITDLVPIKGVPAGQRFAIRLTQELSSRSTHEGDTVKAVSITPVVVDGQIFIPQGSAFEGTVVQANNVGWGFKHETASLTLHWTKAMTPDGRELSIDARVFEVENAQEKVTAKGKIQGIRSTGTIGHSAENGVLSLAGIDPIAYIFASASGSAVLGFAEPEILYPGGTELALENMRPLISATVYPPSVLPMEGDDSGRRQLQSFVKTIPYRTRTKGSNKISDITNLVFIGDAAALQRAFTAAGWLPTDDLYAGSTFRTVKTLTGNQTYTQAPMSVLLLEERPPIFTLSKTTNTFSSRHHLRVFPTEDRYEGQAVMTSSSTQDIGIAFSRKQKTFIHVIDQHIDNERSKIVNDLMYTGCVESLDMVERPWVPRDAYNSTGDRLLTDGEAAVLRINACNDPKTTAPTAAPAPARPQRIVRDTSLTIRNDLYRGNLIYQGIAGVFKVKDFLKSSSELPPDAGAWRKTDASGANYRGYGSNPGLQHRQPGEPGTTPSAEDLALMKKAKDAHKWDPPRYEFALQGGYMHMREDYLSAVGVIEHSSDLNKDGYFIFLADNVGDGWAAGGSVTINSWSHFSNEFSYFRQQVKYQLGTINATIPAGTEQFFDDDDIDAIPIGLVTRQFEYNLLIHATRPTSRWRPYAAIGPVLQLVALNGSPLQKPAGPFTLGLKNIGLFKAAYDFGNTPPLDGGGIFHLGIQYGGGVKYRVTPRMMVRADFRETWTKNPDIIANSYEDFDSNELDDTYSTEIIRIGPEKKFLQDRFTVGVAFTF